MTALFDEITSETNELGRKRVDFPDDPFEISAVAFVMNVGAMNKAMRRFAFAEPDTANFDPFGLQPFSVSDGQQGG